MSTHLPVIQDLPGPIAPDGRRRAIHPADVRGRFTRLRQWGFLVLIGIYVALPWIPIGGHPAVLLDIEHRRFHLFGAAFGAQDTWLLFFVLATVSLALIAATALLGRVWCGYACPQTVFLEGVFRRIERWVEGPSVQRQRRNAGPMTGGKLARKLVKHGLYVIMALGVAHVFLSYFVSLPRLFEMMRNSPGEHPQAFGWVVGITLVMYGNFAWFREQTCLIVCPYGRLQSMLVDSDTVVIGYDTARGEPRGKLKQADAGDGIDCNRCVAVCPTGIDIRNGLQFECIGCAACVDACDEIMHKVKRPRGLIRYDSQRALAGEPRRLWRPRLALYGALAVALVVGAGLAMRTHQPFEAHLLRAPGMPYTVMNGAIKNSYELHLVNKGADPARFTIAATPAPPIEVTLAHDQVDLAPGEDLRMVVTAQRPTEAPPGAQQVVLEITRHAGTEQPATRIVQVRFLGPGQ